jgi:hypothetical protein
VSTILAQIADAPETGRTRDSPSTRSFGRISGGSRRFSQMHERRHSMELAELGDVVLTYDTLESVDYGGSSQLFGAMTGSVRGDRLSGELRLTNLAPRREDNVNLPTVRGLLATDDGGRIWVEMDGVATLRPEDNARVFVTSCRFRTGDDRYQWLNSMFCVLEGVLDVVGVGGIARGRLYACHPTVV